MVGGLSVGGKGATIIHNGALLGVVMHSEFLKAVDERIVVFDGAMGTSLHTLDLPLSDYRDLEN